jgi:asparagine synthase (glutamine-hydrolysing)
MQHFDFQIELTCNYGFEWYSQSRLSVKGYVFDERGNFYSGPELLKYFEHVKDEADFERKLQHANGLYSVVIAKPGMTLLAVDRVRMFPLFYRRKGNRFHIADSVDAFAGTTLNTARFSEFLACGYVSGSETLFSEVSQVRSGEYVLLDNEIRTKYYFNYLALTSSMTDANQLIEHAFETVESTFGRMIRSLNGRMAAIPLSGGYDSRLIVTLFRKLGYEKVTCFTFGCRDKNPEWEISKKVAEALGYSWYFIETTASLIRDYIHSPEFEAYFRFAANGTSMFYMQEFFAARFFKSGNVIPADTVFVPGHTGDFLAGAQLAKLNIPATISIDKIVHRIMNYRYVLNPVGSADYRRYKNQVFKEISDTRSSFPDAPGHSLFENYDQKERLSKLIGNSANVYNFFGYEHRLPFYDLEMLKFFKNLSYRFKKNKYLYNRMVREKYFTPFGVNHDSSKLQPSALRVKWQWIKERIKEFIPEQVKQPFYKKDDPYNYQGITGYMANEMMGNNYTVNTRVKYKNGIIVQWYLYRLKTGLKPDQSKTTSEAYAG